MVDVDEELLGENFLYNFMQNGTCIIQKWKIFYVHWQFGLIKNKELN